MKYHSVAVVALVLALANLAFGQGATSFPMIGITNAQSLQINIAADSTGSCAAELGFQNSSGAPVGPTSSVNLAAGQSASLAVNGNTLVKGFAQRIELLPAINPSTQYPPNPCHASAEVFENFLANTTVAVEGNPDYPIIVGSVYNVPVGLTLFQTARLNVVAYPPVPCMGSISFADSNGNMIGKPLSVNLSAGQAAFLDLPGTELVSKFGQRAEIQPVVNVTQIVGAPNACIASTEVYTTLIGETAVYFPPTPCSPSNTSCVSF